MTVTLDHPLNRAVTRRGSLVMSLFALAWWLTGGLALTAPVLVVVPTGVAVTVATVLVTYTNRRQERPRQVPDNWMSRFNRIGMVQTVVIAGTIPALVSVGAAAAVPAAVCVVVGMHFFPLRATFDQPQYSWTATALCVIGCAALAAFVAGEPQLSGATAGLGAAGVLWATSLSVARG